MNSRYILTLPGCDPCPVLNLSSTHGTDQYGRIYCAGESFGAPCYPEYLRPAKPGEFEVEFKRLEETHRPYDPEPESETECQQCHATLDAGEFEGNDGLCGHCHERSR